MSNGRGTVLVIAVTGAAVVVAVLARVSLGLAVLVALACGAASVPLYRRFRHSDQTPSSDGSPLSPVMTPAPVLSAYRRHTIAPVSLPSSREDYRFFFSATVLWAPSGGLEDPPEQQTATVAVGVIAQRASALAEKRDPAYPELADHELEAALSEPVNITSQGIWVKAEDIQLTVSDTDRERLDKLAEERKDEAVWDHARRYEQSQRAYLKGDVLKDPGSTVVWWLTRNLDAGPDTIAANIPHLRQIFSAANNLDVAVNGTAEDPKSPADRLAGFLESIDIDEDSQVLFADRVARIADAHGLYHVAEEIGLRFGATVEE